MKTVKIKFVGFWDGFDVDAFLPYKILTRHFNVILSETPDYIFCSLFQTPYEYCNYDCVRIFYSGENYSPDFNLVDYAIGFDPISYLDRYIRIPEGYLHHDWVNKAKDKHLNVNHEILNEKNYFCNYIYGHEAQTERNEILEIISRYKRVESPGRYLYNMNNGFKADTWEKKLEFQAKCKFSIAFESITLNGFTTEKILHAFAAGTIPIYFGNPDIEEDFNGKAFVNCHNYQNFEQVLQRIIEIDNDDEQYLGILKESAFREDNDPSKQFESLEKFLINIFEQNQDDVFRRSRVYSPYIHDLRLKRYSRYFGVYQKLNFKFPTKVKSFIMKILLKNRNT